MSDTTANADAATQPPARPERPPAYKPPFLWTQQHIRTLKQMYSEGATYKQIAEAIGADHKKMRNVIAGKIKRMIDKGELRLADRNTYFGQNWADATRERLPSGERIPPRAPTFWTDERNDLLTRLWHTDMTLDQIAAEIGGGGADRLWKQARRLGLGRRKRSTSARRPTPPVPKLKPVAVSPSEAAMEVITHRQPPVPVPHYASADAPESRRLTMAEIDRGECRWPSADTTPKDITFCGHPVHPSRPYCEHHCGRAYRSKDQETERVHAG